MATEQEKHRLLKVGRRLGVQLRGLISFVKFTWYGKRTQPDAMSELTLARNGQLGMRRFGTDCLESSAVSRPTFRSSLVPPFR